MEQVSNGHNDLNISTSSIYVSSMQTSIHYVIIYFLESQTMEDLNNEKYKHETKLSSYLWELK